MVDAEASHYVDERAQALHVAEAFDPALAMRFRRSLASHSSAIRTLNGGVSRVAMDTGMAESKHHPAPAEPTLANVTRSLSKSQRSVVLILDEAQDLEGFDADLTGCISRFLVKSVFHLCTSSDFGVGCVSSHLVRQQLKPWKRRIQAMRESVKSNQPKNMRRTRPDATSHFESPQGKPRRTPPPSSGCCRKFIKTMLKEGRYGSDSEPMRAGLRLLEEQEGERARLRVELMEGNATPDAGPLDIAAVRSAARVRPED